MSPPTPVTITNGCLRCGADLTYDVFEFRWTCARACGYTQKGLKPDPKEMVKKVATDVLTLAELGKRLNSNAAGAAAMLRAQGILTEDRDGQKVVRAEHVQHLQPKVRTAKAGPVVAIPAPATTTAPTTPTIKVQLASGGTVALGVNVNLLDLTEGDRLFVFGLIDQVKGYGQER